MTTTLPVPVQLRANGPADGERLAAAAKLTRALADTLLASVQRTTELNWHASRLLLARNCATNWRDHAENSAVAWRWSWHAYQICTTTAAQVLDLVRSHAQAGSDDLWRGLRQASAALPGVDGRRALELQASLRAIESAFDAYLAAVASLQRELIGLAQQESR
jgi:hypothetical protein